MCVFGDVVVFCSLFDVLLVAVFMERLPEVYQMWMGTHKTAEDFKQIYGVDTVKFDDELVDTLTARETKPEAGFFGAVVHPCPPVFGRPMPRNVCVHTCAVAAVEGGRVNDPVGPLLIGSTPAE